MEDGIFGIVHLMLIAEYVPIRKARKKIGWVNPVQTDLDHKVKVTFAPISIFGNHHKKLYKSKL